MPLPKFTLSIETKATLFEFYTHWIWPIHRIFVKHYYSRRCCRCGIAEECSSLDQNQICTLCHQFNQRTSIAPSTDTSVVVEKLDELLTQYTGKGESNYDALVLFSGGKDSSFLLHRLHANHPQLRLLALTVDNSFMSAIAMGNSVTVAKKIGIDHMTLAPKSRVFRNMFRYALTHLDGRGSAMTVDMLDGEFLIDQGRRIAATHAIPLVIIGYSYEQIKIEHLEEINNKYSNGTTRTAAADYPLDALTLPEDHHYWWDRSCYPEKSIPKLVFPFYAWNLSEEYIKSEVDRLGLIDKKRSSPVVTNNILIPLQGVVDIASLGYSSWEPEFTQMVREGKADKKHWQYTFELLQYTARTGFFIRDGIALSLSWLDLTPEMVGLDAKCCAPKNPSKHTKV